MFKVSFNSQVMCSFLQVYQEKVYDLLNPRFIVDLPVREHPKKGMRVFSLVQSCLLLARSIVDGLPLMPPADWYFVRGSTPVVFRLQLFSSCSMVG